MRDRAGMYAWRRGFLTAVLFGGLILGGWGQGEISLPAGPMTPVQAVSADSLESLEALEQALSSMEQEAQRAQQSLVTATDEVTRAERSENLREIRDSLQEQRLEFEKFAVNIDLRPFVEEKSEAFDWQTELGKLLKPILAELENATAQARAIGELRGQLKELGEQKELASQAVVNLESLLAAQPTPALTARLQERLDHWKRVEGEASNRYRAIDLQMQQRLQEKESLLDETTGFAKNFFSTRGMNLLLAAGAFALVFFGIRGLIFVAGRVKKKQSEKSFGSRLSALLFHIFSVVGGLVAMMVVFNMAGDWFMLGIIILFLLGVGWASIQTLPGQIEMVKLMLNIGPVREGERLIFQGVPYRVDVLSFSAKLVNPLLDGGVQILPVKALVGHHSRLPGVHEEWFPCRAGDWVELSDGRSGRVAYQNPSSVQLVEWGGAQIVYPTETFVQLNPRNLSTNFRIETVFGIDYQQQAVATSEIPEKMLEKLESALPQVVDPTWIKDVQVLFHAAAASSLEYQVLLDLDGKAASKMPMLRGSIQAILVDACNENGWPIPFTQITVHSAS